MSQMLLPNHINKYRLNHQCCPRIVPNQVDFTVESQKLNLKRARLTYERDQSIMPAMANAPTNPPTAADPLALSPEAAPHGGL